MSSYYNILFYSQCVVSLLGFAIAVLLILLEHITIGTMVITHIIAVWIPNPKFLKSSQKSNPVIKSKTNRHITYDSGQYICNTDNIPDGFEHVEHFNMSEASDSSSLNDSDYIISDTQIDDASPKLPHHPKHHLQSNNIESNNIESNNIESSDSDNVMWSIETDTDSYFQQFQLHVGIIDNS